VRVHVSIPIRARRRAGAPVRPVGGLVGVVVGVGGPAGEGVGGGLPVPGSGDESEIRHKGDFWGESVPPHGKCHR